MEKAKMTYDLCVQKVTEAQNSIETAKRTQEEAVKRLDVAERTLAAAVTAYQCSIAPNNVEHESSLAVDTQFITKGIVVTDGKDALENTTVEDSIDSIIVTDEQNNI